MSTDRTVNPWRKFKNLLPGGARTVVTITVNQGNGTSSALLHDGTAILVKGESVAPGQKALVVDGEVRQQVPSLPQTAVEV